MAITKTLFTDRLKLFIGLIGCEITQCKRCKSTKVASTIQHKGNVIFKWFICKNCGRNFWSEEKLYNKKPKWFKNKVKK